MLKFQKYKSIENHYREKFLTDTLSYNPVYHTCRYVAQEKIHGANFQINFHMEENGAVSFGYGKRSGIIAHDENFYNHLATMNKDVYQDMIEKICKVMRKDHIKDIILYGEFAGPGVQSGVEYGPNKFVVFFDIIIDGHYLTPKQFYSWMDNIGYKHLCVPIVAIFENLKEALDFEVEGVDSVFYPKEGNTWEGVVIKPWDMIATNQDNEQVLFYIKKKDSKFGDKQKKSKDTRADIPKELADAQHAFSEYLTETRLQDVFSKYGPITDQKQVGEYIKHMMNDAKEDFFKDCMDLFNDVPDKHKGKVFSVTGKIVAPMLMRLV